MTVRVLQFGITRELDQALRLLPSSDEFRNLLHYLETKVLPDLQSAACGGRVEPSRDWVAGQAYFLERFLREWKEVLNGGR